MFCIRMVFQDYVKYSITINFSHWFKTVILPHRYTDIKPMIIFIGCIVVDFVGVDFFALYVILYITGVLFYRFGVEWLVYDR